MKFVKIKDISLSKTRKKVYDVTIANNHNLFANKCLLHNCDYRGNIHVHLFNHSDQDVWIKRGDKIAQLVMREVWTGEIIEVEEISTDTERSQGGFGSTDARMSTNN